MIGVDNARRVYGLGAGVSIGELAGGLVGAAGSASCPRRSSCATTCTPTPRSRARRPGPRSGSPGALGAADAPAVAGTGRLVGVGPSARTGGGRAGRARRAADARAQRGAVRRRRRRDARLRARRAPGGTGGAGPVGAGRTCRSALLAVVQPREELSPSGAEDVVASGVLAEHDVRAVVGAHVQPRLPAGTVVGRPGRGQRLGRRVRAARHRQRRARGVPAPGRRTRSSALSACVLAAQSLARTAVDPMHVRDGVVRGAACRRCRERDPCAGDGDRDPAGVRRRRPGTDAEPAAPHRPHGRRRLRLPGRAAAAVHRAGAEQRRRAGRAGGRLARRRRRRPARDVPLLRLRRLRLLRRRGAEPDGVRGMRRTTARARCCTSRRSCPTTPWSARWPGPCWPAGWPRAEAAQRDVTVVPSMLAPPLLGLGDLVEREQVHAGDAPSRVGEQRRRSGPAAWPAGSRRAPRSGRTPRRSWPGTGVDSPDPDLGRHRQQLGALDRAGHAHQDRQRRCRARASVPPSGGSRSRRSTGCSRRRSRARACPTSPAP